MPTPKPLIAFVAVIAAAATIGAATVGRSPTPPPSQAAPEIFGTTAPATHAARPQRSSSGDAAALGVARRWTAAWGLVTTCPADSRHALDRVLELSTGDLHASLSAQPPRPTGERARACRGPRIKHVRIYPADEGWYAISTRHGDGLRPLRLRLITTAAGVRVTSIDF